MDSKQERCYNKYMETLVKEKATEIDERWEEVRQKVIERDEGLCRLTKVITFQELAYLKIDPKGYPLDVCHIVPRSKCKTLYYEIDNLLLISRLFHKRLDSYQHPITGEPIDKDKRDCWWIRMIGKEKWLKLQYIYKGDDNG